MNHMKTLHLWYSNPDVKFNMIKYLYNRELALLVPRWYEHYERSIRMLKCHSTQHLDLNIKAVNMFLRDTPYNFFYSLARYVDGIPNQTLNFKLRNNQYWIKHHHEEISGFDYMIDIDGDHENFRETKKSTNELRTLLNELDVPYQLRFTGRGFHFIIPSCYIPLGDYTPFKDKNQYKMFAGMSRVLQKKIKQIDLKVYDSRRVCKIPFSIANYENVQYVCLPFATADEFKKFSLKDALPDNLMQESFKGFYEITFNKTGKFSNLKKYCGVD